VTKNQVKGLIGKSASGYAFRNGFLFHERCALLRNVDMQVL